MAKLKEEFFKLLRPIIFFFVELHLVTFIRVLIAKGSHFDPLSTVSIAIASLILGSAEKKCCGYSLDQTRCRHFERENFASKR
jgi:hypothetical protein